MGATGCWPPAELQGGRRLGVGAAFRHRQAVQAHCSLPLAEARRARMLYLRETISDLKLRRNDIAVTKVTLPTLASTDPALAQLAVKALLQS